MAYQVINASAHATGLPGKSVHTVICSPPYYGLRAYAGDQLVDWAAVAYSPIAGLPTITIEPMRCALGAEPTIEAYIGHLILVAREMWRVLRNDGVFWCNLGDSYAGSWGNYGGQNRGKGTQRPIVDGSLIHNKAYDGTEKMRPVTSMKQAGIKKKDLMMIPARFALAAQADGWTLRQDIIWSKKAPMTESVTDRCTKAHEYVWMLTKKPRYWFDNEAIKEPAQEWKGKAGSFARSGLVSTHVIPGQSAAEHRADRTDRVEAANGRNKRSVWTLGPSPYPGAHFATYPPALVEPMILASTSARGVCPACGAQWRRLVEKKNPANDGQTGSAYEQGTTAHRLARLRQAARANGGEYTNSTLTIGWMPTCNCNAGEPIPATVLDPFVGSGTTLLVATELGRDAIGVDISSEYLTDLVPKRLASATKKKPKKSSAKQVKTREFKQIELFTEV